MIAGAIVLKFIEHRVNYHQLQAICSGVSCLFLGFFSIAPDGLIQYVTLFIASMFCLLIDVAVNVNMISLYRAEEIDFWMLSIHGTFGIGGLIGPLIVWMFETNSYIVIGLLMATMIPSYLYL